MSLKASIRSYIVENFLYGEEVALDDQDSFLDKGVVDSTGILELIDFVEGEFEVEVADDEVTRENLDSIQRLADFIERKRS